MGFVISDGTLASIAPPISQGSVHLRGSIPLNSGLTATYGALYRSQPEVRTVVSFLARNIASLTLKSYRQVSLRERLRLSLVDSPLAALLEYEPAPRVTPFWLMGATVADKAIYDRAYWLKIKGADGVRQLRRIPPPMIAPADGSWFEVDTYIITRMGRQLPVPRSSLVVFEGYAPDSPIGATSPIETLRTVLADEVSATEARTQLWQRGARTSGVITRPIDAPDWNENGGRERFMSDWENWSGSNGRAGGTPLLEDGMQWVASGVTPKDAQYVESRKLTREEAAAAYHIAPTLVGILDHATFSNISEQHVQLYVDTLGSWMTEIDQAVRLDLVPEFYPGDKSVYCEFDFGSKLAGDFEQQAGVLQAAIGAPWLAVNEGRAKLNLPPVDGGDDLIVPMNVTVGGQANPQDSAPPKSGGPRLKAASTPTPAAAPYVAMLKAHFTRQQRAVAAALAGDGKSRKTPADELLPPARWNAELSADLLKLSLPLATAAGTASITKLTDGQAEYDQERTRAYLQAQALGVAQSVNLVTNTQLDQAQAVGQDPAQQALDVFAIAIAVRAFSLGQAQATSVHSWGTLEGARQSGLPARKQWGVPGPNPRPAHAAMAGQTVELDAKFSNGARWPADAINLETDDVAGCTCTLDVIPEGVQ